MKLLNSLTNHQIVNLSLSSFLVIGLITTAYVSTNLTNLQTEAARGNSYHAICFVTPESVAEFSPYTISGNSVPVGTGLEVVVTNPDVSVTLKTTVQENGGYSVSGVAGVSGTYSVYVYSTATKMLVENCSFEVV